MKQEVMEIDMEFFSKHVGPYFTWLESKIESGWEQSDSVQKDVLKEVRYVSTNMRARFILGVSRDDFAKEAARTLELLELAAEAFPSESDEIETKIKFFSRAISNELGETVLPTRYRGMNSEVVVKAAPAAAMTIDSPKVEAPATKIAPSKPAITPPKAPIVQMKQTVKPVEAKVAAKPQTIAKPAAKIEKKTVKKAVPVKKEIKPAKEAPRQEAPKKNGKPSKKPIVEWNKVKAWIVENWPKRF